MKFRNLILLLFVIAGMVPAQNAFRDSTGSYRLHTVYVTAERINTEQASASGQIEIITNDKVQSANGSRLQDILKTSAGVVLKSYGYGPSLNTVSINGMGAEHTVIMIDGVRLNSFQNPSFDLSLIPKALIESVEIARGGMSSLNSSDAMGGIINIKSGFTSGDADKPFGFKLSTSAGSYGLREYMVKFSGKTGILHTDVFLSNESSDGNYEYYFNNGIEKIKKQRENSAYTMTDAGFSAGMNFGNSALRFLSTYSFQDKQIAGIETGNASAGTVQKDKIWNNIIKYSDYLNEWADADISFNFQNSLMNYNTASYINSYYKNTLYSVSLNTSFDFSFLKSIVSYDFAHGELRSDELSGFPNRNRHSLSASVNIIPWEFLQISPSVRHDYYSDTDMKATTGRVGLNVKPFSKIVFHLRANVGNNFRMPSFNDLYWNLAGNKNLDPEKSLNAEAGAFYGFKSFVDGNADFSFAYVEAEDKIMWIADFTGIWKPRNIAGSVSRVYSASLEFSFKISEGLKLASETGASFNDVIKTTANYRNDPTYNKKLFYIPDKTVKTSLRLIHSICELNILFSHTGVRYADMQNKTLLPVINLTDANAAVNFHLGSYLLTARAEVNNIFNADYQIMNGYPMPLRNYRIKLSINY